MDKDLLVPMGFVMALAVGGMVFTHYMNGNTLKSYTENCAVRWEGLETKVITQGNRRKCMVKVDDFWRYEKNIQINVSQ